MNEKKSVQDNNMHENSAFKGEKDGLGGVKETKKGLSDEQKTLLSQELTRQVKSTVVIPADLARKEKRRRFDAAVVMANSIRAHDYVDSLLAAQMSAAHQMAMTYMATAAHSPDHEFGLACAKQAEKLMSLFAHQVEVLDKRHGKGEQKVTVEKHIFVQPGSHAVIGDVTITPTQPKSAGQAGAAAKTIEHSAQTPFDMELPPAKVAVPVKKSVRQK